MIQKQISIVVPTLNEEGNVAELVARTHSALTEHNYKYEIIFIDDHSTDNTVAVLSKLAKQYPVRVYSKIGNRGKAESLIQGFGYSQADYLGMIDADMQYSPDYIPEMLAKLEQENLDIVIADRTDHKTNFLRQFASKIFVTIFVSWLHNLKVDSQSGLKVFRREVIDRIELKSSGWAFDLNFLVRAKQHGYKIGSYPIVFEARLDGVTKVNVLKVAWQLATSAINLKLAGAPVARISEQESKIGGKGFRYKGAEYIHHTDLHYEQTALKRFGGKQIQFIILGVVIYLLLLVLDWHTTLLLTFGLLTILYFADLLFNLFLIYRSFTRNPEIQIIDEDVDAMAGYNWPRYTVFCPLYKEWQVIPQFVEAMSKLDYPTDKLQIMLLLEENDKESIAKTAEFDLPSNFDVVIVPHSMPKTKPKALNYGLQKATGEYIVIYDAEDVPDPKQLKKAVMAFEHSDESVVCVQAKLNFYNPYQNILTRVFTAEYSLWFDLVLPGMQTMRGPIPLGGTSNHFRTRDVVKLKGWDSFNVTEDCDLGIRLAKQGYTTAIIESTTLEEANSHFWNWYSQRSRWIKGYIQTYLVHMRNPREFADAGKMRHLVFFQFIVGGKILSMFINPIMWCITIIYFAFRPVAGEFIESFFPSAILYLGVFSFVFGNFLYLYYYMIACAKRGHYSLIKYVYLVPFYWLMMSFASWRAVWEMIVKPHYWAKTTHGLHLTDAQKSKPDGFESDLEVEVSGTEPIMEASIISDEDKIEGPVLNDQNDPNVEVVEQKSWLKSVVSGGGILLLSMSAVNFINFMFNALLGRILSFEELALLAFINTLWSLFGFFINSVGTTMTHKVSYLVGMGQEHEANNFYRRTVRGAIGISLLLSVIWLVASPWTGKFFNVSELSVLLLFTPILSLGIILSASRGLLEGRLKFSSLSAMILIESLVKFGVAMLLVHYGLNHLVYLSIPISIGVAAAGVYFLANKYSKIQEPHKLGFPKTFYFSALLSGLSTTVFLSLDIILVKHYLSDRLAGEYVLLALVGKMIYFFGSLPNNLMVTYVSRDLGSKNNPLRILYLLGSVTLGLVAVGYIGLAVFGQHTIPLLLGDKAYSILPYVPLYVLAISIFTLTKPLITYHLSKEQYLFPAASLIMSASMTVGIIMWHNNVHDIVNVIFFSSMVGMSLMLIMHFAEQSLDLFSRGIRFVFAPVAVPVPTGSGKRILIFNWRDTKHSFAGGAEVYIHEMAKHWVSNGNTVTIFAGSDGKVARYEIVDGVNVIRRGGFFMVYVWAVVYYFWQFRGNYDVVIDCENGIPFFTPLYVKEQKFCLMHHVHQEVFRHSLIKPLALFAQFLEKDLMPFVYQKIKFITVSESSKKEIEDIGLGLAGIDIVHPGVDVNALTYGVESKQPTVLYLGRLKAYKSVDVLIKAFHAVAAAVDSAKLIIAGSGEEEKNLKELVKEMDIEDKVTFLGKVTEKEKIKLMQKAWVFVNPSFMEGWGITTVEANACGTPIVASNVPGLRDSVRNPHTGFLVEHGDHEEFANRILRLLEDEKLRNRMSKQAFDWAQNFDWRKTSRTFLEVINNPR